MNMVSISPVEYVKITVSQAAGQTSCTYSYTRAPSETTFPGIPFTITVTAITQPGCVWSTTPNYEASNTNFLG